MGGWSRHSGFYFDFRHEQVHEFQLVFLLDRVLAISCCGMDHLLVQRVLVQFQIATKSHELCTICVRPWVSIVTFDETTVLELCVIFYCHIAKDWYLAFLEHMFQGCQTIEDRICVFSDDGNRIILDAQNIGINLVKEAC